MVIVSFLQVAPAQNLCAYLNSQNIKVLYKFDAELNQHQIVLQDPEKQEQAIAITKDFVRNPNQERFVASAWDNNIGPMKINPAIKFNFVGQLSDLPKTPVVAVGLGVCLALYFLYFAMGQFQYSEAMYFRPFSELAMSHQWWRLLTPALIHFSVMHLMFNLLWWWWLGKQIEGILGSYTLLLLFVLLAFVTNFAQHLVGSVNFGGLSGVVYGLLGLVWWLQWLRPEAGLKVPLPVVGFGLIWMILGFADVLWVSMGNAAHAVGLLSGCLIAALISKLMK